MGCLFVFILCASVFLSSSCVSKSKAQAQAREAYLAGQQAAMARMAKNQEPIVTFVGPVKHPTIPWSENLTLAKAIIAAGYLPPGEPSQIMIVREGQAIPIDPKRLLSGEDIPLLSGDLIQLTR